MLSSSQVDLVIVMTAQFALVRACVRACVLSSLPSRFQTAPKEVSEMFYTAVCFPWCQLLAGTSFPLLPSSKCPVTGISFKCSGKHG